MALPTYEELTGDQGQPNLGLPSYEDLVGGQQSEPDSVKQATSEAAAATADNSWFSPEFRSGALFREVLGPAATAAQTAVRVVGRALGPFAETPVTTFKPGVQDYAATAQMGVSPAQPGVVGIAQATTGIPPHYQQALAETANERLIPKETMPLYWMGRYNRMLARVLNPQGPPAAQAIRTGLEAVGGFEEKAGEAAAGLVTPFNALLAVAPELLPARLAGLANKGLASYFLGRALWATPDQIARFNASKDTAEKAGIVAETMVSYAPVLAFHARGKAARAAAAARRTGEEPTTEPVGTTEMPATADLGITRDQFRGWAESRLNDLSQLEREMTPIEQAEAKDLQEGLAEGGDINALAVKQGVNLSDVTPEAPAAPAAEEALKAGPREEEAPVSEPAKVGITLTEGGEKGAIEPGNAQVETTPAPLGVEEGAPGAVKTTGGRDNVVGKAQGAEAGGPVPSEAPPEPVGPVIPPEIETQLAAAENSAAGRDKSAAAVAISEVKQLLRDTKNLSKEVTDAVLSRVAKVESVIRAKPKTLPTPTKTEITEPNAVEYAGNTYIYGGEGPDGIGVWHKAGPGHGRLVGHKVTRAHLDTVWQARKAIAEAAKEEAARKKAAPKTEPTAAPVPTTRETPSREEIGKGEAQPPKPGTKVNHWTWDDGEVIGPGKRPGHTLVRFDTGDEMQFKNEVVNNKLIPRAEAKAKGLHPDEGEAPKPEEPAKPDRATEVRKVIEDLRTKIIDDKNRATTLKGKERVAINKSIRTDQAALRKLLVEEQKFPRAKPTPAEVAADMERQIADREKMRKSLAARVKKESFIKKDVVRQTSTGMPEKVPAFSYKGLQIHQEPGSNYKPWRVTHEGSGKLQGHFDSEAEAKAFALRTTDHGFDFTKPYQDVVRQKKAFGTANFADLVTDPYGYLADAGTRLKRRIIDDKTQGGFMLNEDIGPDIREFGRRLYQRGVTFRDWAVNMVRHLGERIVEHLRDIWDSVTGRNLLPGRGERGGTSPGGGSLKAQQEQKKLAPGSGAAQPRPIVTKSGAIIQPKYNPAAANAPAKVNAGTGGTTRPPPPGSALGPTPPGSNPHQVWWDRSISDWKKAWERYWPGMFAAHRLEPGTVVGSTHQRWIQGPANGMWEMFHKSSWYPKVSRMTREQIVDAEHDARTKFNALRAAGQGELQATLNAIKGNPLRDYFVDQMNEMVKEKVAAARLNVKMPGYIEGPYLPRLTDGENLPLIKIGGTHEGVVTQLRRSLGHFEKSREYETMKDGIANHVNYREPIEAIIQRRRVGEQLKATAQALDDLEKGGVIYRDRAKALANSKDKDPQRMDGFGGDTWWIRNRQEARAIDQNLNNSSPHSQWATFMQVVNNYARNPNLWNPAPHITKNMFFKYALARINNLSLKPDTPEFRRMTKAQKIDLYHSVFPMPGDQPGTTRLLHSERVPEMIAGESKKWFDKITRKGLLLNRPSQKFIFERADPYMRYKLWESYFRKGMSAQEAGGNVLFDLIRYDENSGALNLYKSIPGNFFSTWRTGTYVTIYKAMRTHPIRTLMFFGAVEYMREMIYRKTGKWTHLPIDYLFNPLAETVEASIKAKRAVALGRSPAMAYAGVAGKTAGILATTAAFGPGGSQAPTTIKDVMGALQGDEVAMTRFFNMFWGLSQMFNIPQEYLAFQRDKKPEHLVNILAGAAFGTHDAISYEPRRMGKWIPEWMPGMAIPQEMKGYAAMRQRAEDIATRAAVTRERRFGIFNWANQGSKEQQVEQLLRASGVIKQKRQPGGAAPSGYPRGGP